jgi:hypothetical protein
VLAEDGRLLRLLEIERLGTPRQESEDGDG